MKFWRTPLDADKMKIPRGELHIIVERCKGCAFRRRRLNPKIA